MHRTFSTKVGESKFYVIKPLRTILSGYNYASSFEPALRRRPYRERGWLRIAS